MASSDGGGGAVFFRLAGERQSPLHNNVGTTGPFTLAAGRKIAIPSCDFFPRAFQDSLICQEGLTAIFGGSWYYPRSEGESDLPRAAEPANI